MTHIEKKVNNLKLYFKCKAQSYYGKQSDRTTIDLYLSKNIVMVLYIISMIFFSKNSTKDKKKDLKITKDHDRTITYFSLRNCALGDENWESQLL